MALRKQKAQQVQYTPKTPVPPTASANDDELVNTIRRVFQEKFEVHERKNNDMIKSNMKLTSNRLDNTSAEVIKITKSLEFTQNKLDEGLKSVKRDITKIKSEMKESTEDLGDLNLVSDKLIKLQNRSRMNNLRIGGITEKPNETWEEGKEKVIEVIKDKLNIENFVNIDYCHCTS